MVDTLYKYMKPGIVHFKAYPEALSGKRGAVYETMIKIAEDDFFSVVEMGMVKDPVERDQVAKLLKTTHLEVAYATQPLILTNKLNLNSLDEKTRRRAVDKVKEGIKEAYHLGAKWVRLIAGKDPGDEKREEAKKILIESINELCEFAREVDENMELALKIFDRDVDKENLIGHFSDARDVAEVLAKENDNFGLLSDLSHFPLLKEKPEEALPLVKDYLTAFHIGDCVVRDPLHPIYGDLQPRFGIEGGENDTEEVAAYFQLLYNMGFLDPANPPVVSAEVRPLMAEDISSVVVANAKRVWKRAWSMVEL